MYKEISKTPEIIERLRLEGKIKYLDSPEDLQKIEEMNQYMEEVRREYIHKAAMSEISASKVYLRA